MPLFFSLQLITVLTEDPKKLCGAEKSKYLVIPSPLEETIDKMMQTLCSLDYNVIQKELEEWIDMNRIQQIVSKIYFICICINLNSHFTNI